MDEYTYWVTLCTEGYYNVAYMRALLAKSAISKYFVMWIWYSCSYIVKFI